MSVWRGIDEEHVEMIIPENLFLFLSVLLGGTSVLEYDTNQDKSTKSKVCNLAQDIVYAVSKHQKLTPKHVGLGLTFHQATRSEALVDLFHSAGHTIGMETIRRIDTSIANNILRHFEENGNIYIPTGITPYVAGKLVIGSCDNIDVPEATLDGKNTFHSTQMRLWQRGPCASNVDVSNLEIGREKVLKQEVVSKLHELDKATTSRNRPSPCFDSETQL